MGIVNRDISLDHIYSDDLAKNFATTTKQILQKYLFSHLSDKSHIIDLGCGSGTFLHELKQYYPQSTFIGIDRSPQIIHPDIIYQQGSICDTNITSSSIALVFTINMSDYINLSFTPSDLFQEIDRILIPGGIYLPYDSFRTKLIAPFQRAGYNSFGLDFQVKPHTLI